MDWKTKSFQQLDSLLSEIDDKNHTLFNGKEEEDIALVELLEINIQDSIVCNGGGMFGF